MVPTAVGNRIMRFSGSDLLRDLDLTDDELTHLLDLAAEVKQTPAEYARALAGKSIALLFEKPSLRTRLTFELAIRELGGNSVFCEGPVGGREPLKDVARNLDRWVDGIVARVFTQETIEELAQWASVPVINALSDLYHPCQALADVQTIRERFEELKGLKLTFLGDGNNVAQSLMITGIRLKVPPVVELISLSVRSSCELGLVKTGVVEPVLVETLKVPIVPSQNTSPGAAVVDAVMQVEGVQLPPNVTAPVESMVIASPAPSVNIKIGGTNAKPACGTARDNNPTLRA